jgi:hypothetical protein
MNARKLTRAIATLLVVTFGGILTPDANAYIRTNYRENGKADRDLTVAGGKLAFEIERDGSYEITDGSDLDAIRAAMAEIRRVPTSAADIVDAGSFDFPASVGAREGLTRDQKNRLYFFTRHDPAMPAVAVTSVFYDPNSGQIHEADISVNEADYAYSTATYGSPDADLGPNTADIQEIVTHELMHALGIGHSAVAGRFDPSTGLQVSGYSTGDFSSHATMFPFASGTIQGRSLAPDDVAALSVAYPTGARLGEISGRVVDGASGRPVKGAHVVAVRADDPETPVVGTLSGIGQGLSGGQFHLAGLPPGDYYIRIEPLAATTNPFSEAYTPFGGFDTSFAPEFFSGEIETAYDDAVAMNDAAMLSIDGSTQRGTEITIVTNAAPRAPRVDSATYKNGKLKIAGGDFLVGYMAVEVSGNEVEGVKYPKKFMASNGMASRMTSNDPTIGTMMGASPVQVVVVNTLTGQRSVPVAIRQ